MEIKFIKLSDNAVEPTYGRYGDVGMDLYTTEEITIKPHETVVIPTDIAMGIPIGYEGQVRPRSGNSLNGVKGCFKIHEYQIETVLGTVINKVKEECQPYLRVQLGTIDSNYRGNIGIITYNQEDYEVIVPKGTKLAQLIIAPVTMIDLMLVDSLESTNRGEKGFGSSDEEV